MSHVNVYTDDRIVPIRTDNIQNTIVSVVDILREDITKINNKISKQEAFNKKINRRKTWTNPRIYKRPGKSHVR